MALFWHELELCRKTEFKPGVGMVFEVLPIRVQAIFLELANEQELPSGPILHRARDIISYRN